MVQQIDLTYNLYLTVADQYWIYRRQTKYGWLYTANIQPRNCT